MKRLIKIFVKLILFIGILFTSCHKDDEPILNTTITEIDISGQWKSSAIDDLNISYELLITKLAKDSFRSKLYNYSDSIPTISEPSILDIENDTIHLYMRPDNWGLILTNCYSTTYNNNLIIWKKNNDSLYFEEWYRIN